MKRSEQKEKRRNEILASGLDLFIRKGLTSTKIQDIADEVGMSVGLLFNYFESKEKLYEELIKIATTTPRTMLNDIEGDPIVFFETAVKQIFHYLKTDPFVTKMFVLMNQAKFNDAAPESVKKLINSIDYITPSVKIIEQGQQNGTIKTGNPFALSIAFWGAIAGVAEIIAFGSNAPIPESDWIVDILRRRNEQ